MGELRRFGEDPQDLNILKDFIVDEASEEMPTCPDCGGLGYIFGANGRVRYCKCKKAEITKHRINISGIPQRFQDKDLENFVIEGKGASKRREALKTLKGFIKAYPNMEKKGLLIVGAPGSGKTHLAVGVLKELIRRGFSGKFYNVLAMLEQIKRAYSSEFKSEQSFPEGLAEVIKTIDVLVLDGLCNNRVSQWAQERIYAIVDTRYNLDKNLIVTTTLKEDELREELGAATVSRLWEMCYKVECPAYDYRFADTPEPKEEND